MLFRNNLNQVPVSFFHLHLALFLSLLLSVLCFPSRLSCFCFVRFFSLIPISHTQYNTIHIRSFVRSFIHFLSHAYLTNPLRSFLPSSLPSIPSTSTSTSTPITKSRILILSHVHPIFTLD